MQRSADGTPIMTPNKKGVHASVASDDRIEWFDAIVLLIIT